MVTVTPDDVAARWRSLTSAEQASVSTLIDDALDIIAGRWSDYADRASGQSVVRVVATMVKRAMMNAGSEGLESLQETAGPFSQNRSFANPLGSLYLTREDVLVFEPEGRTPRAMTGWLA